MLGQQQRVIEKKPAGRIIRVFKTLTSNKQALIGSVIIGFLLSVALIVEIASLLYVRITPFDPLQQGVGPLLSGPSFSNYFGTDNVGRDLFSRIIVATPGDVGIGLAVVGVAFLVGASVGSLAAFKGGLFDEVLMRGTDVIFALPALLIAVAIAVSLGRGLSNMMFALMLIWWPPYARLARGEALKVSHQNYIQASKIAGKNTPKIIGRHIIPNIFTTLLVYATLDVGTVILVYAGLSYLGLSVTPPAPDWGQMVSAYQDYLVSAPWLALIPGFVIALGVIGFSLLGDGIRDALEAR
jgi:peptide/nickel transport system permease protein